MPHTWEKPKTALLGLDLMSQARTDKEWLLRGQPVSLMLKVANRGVRWLLLEISRALKGNVCDPLRAEVTLHGENTGDKLFCDANF